MHKKILLPAAGAITALVAMWGFYAISPAPTPVSTTGWQVSIESCATDPQKTIFDEECLVRTWDKAWEEGNLAQINAALVAATEKTPILGNQCHSAGHKAGQRAWAKSKDAKTLINAAKADKFACNNGFVHGVMDGMAHSAPTDRSMHEVYKICETFEKEARSNCIDGSGHATWQATHDTDKSLELCSKYKSPIDQGTCFAGVMMQMYLPDTDGSRPAMYTEKNAHIEMPELCRKVAEKAPKEVVYACQATGGGMLTLDAKNATAAYVRQEKGEAYPDDLKYTVEDIRKLWREAADKCVNYGKDSEACEAGIIPSIVWFSRYDDITKSICEEFRKDGKEEQCLNSTPG